MILRNELPEPDEGGRPSRHGQNAAGPILAVTSDGRITKANLQARRVFGRDEPLEGEYVGSALGRIMAGHGLSSQRLHLKIRDEEGEERDVILVLSDEERVRPHLRLVTQQEPVQAAVTLDAPAASNAADFIAHELRNNLAITLGLSQILEANFDRLTRDDRLSAIKGIQLEAHHALQVLEGLLKLVESRHRGAIPESAVPVHSVLRRVVSDHVRRHAERTVTVSGDEPVFAAGDSTWMQIAIGNLLSNAEKVTPADTPIQMNVHQAGDRVVVMVLDEGKALSGPAYQGLWDIYMKGPPAGVELSGSGIGLSLCKELVQAMGGRVWAGPRTGGGSAFAISLRCVLENSSGIAAAA